MKWTFPGNNNTDVIGISEGGVETFQGTPLKSLAREICQNSLDASSSNEKIMIEFKPFAVKRENFPGVSSLGEAFKLSLDFWSLQSTKKATDFFRRALRVINEDEIQFLRISDYNTTGLTGSHEEYNSPWCNLTKSSGNSDKGSTAGGSFGIGKFAPFACSDFRTVFYSTYDTEQVSASQGISRITSFKKRDGEITIGTGYYGEEKNSPMFSQLVLDSSFFRDERVGTDIYIAAFKYFNTDWKSDVIASILDGFLYAIYTGKLEVQVDDVMITSDSLQELLVEYETSLSENAEKYYFVLTSEKTKWFELNYRNNGVIKLGLLIDNDLHRKVAMIRKTGMKILDRGNINGVISFAGVVLIEGDQVNDYLRNLENPQHNKWEPERIEPKEKVPEARYYVKGLIDYIKSSLQELVVSESDDEIDPSVGDFLPDDGKDESEDKQEVESIQDEIKTFEKTITSPRSKISNKGSDSDIFVSTDEIDDNITEEVGSGLSTHDREGISNDSNNGSNFQEGEGEHLYEQFDKLMKVTPDKIRSVCINKENGEYSLLFVPKETATDGYIEIFLSAETSNYNADIVSAFSFEQPNVTLEGNRIKGINFEEKKPFRMKIQLDYKDYCTMEVKAYGYKI